jgi:hypothetical protein
MFCQNDIHPFEQINNPITHTYTHEHPHPRTRIPTRIGLVVTQHLIDVLRTLFWYLLTK